MDINQLSEIIKTKILKYKIINNIEIEDKSYLHKDHKTNEDKKFHLILKINSPELKKQKKLDSNRLVYKILNSEIKDLTLDLNSEESLVFKYNDLYEINQEIKIEDKKYHFIDHPYFGIIIRISSL